MSGGESWVERAEPRVPEALVRRIGPVGDSRSRPGRAVLEKSGLEALGAAMRPGGLERDGAFALLTADALLTWAAEACLDEDRPETGLEVLARRIAEVPERG